jgi:flagellar motor switch protein FliN
VTGSAAPEAPDGESGPNMPVIDDVPLDVAVVLGATTMPIHQLLRMGRGAVIELDQTEDDDVLILANNLPVARGTVSVNGSRIAIEVRELIRKPSPTAEL